MSDKVSDFATKLCHLLDNYRNGVLQLMWVMMYMQWHHSGLSRTPHELQQTITPRVYTSSKCTFHLHVQLQSSSKLTLKAAQAFVHKLVVHTATHMRVACCVQPLLLVAF